MTSVQPHDWFHDEFFFSPDFDRATGIESVRMTGEGTSVLIALQDVPKTVRPAMLRVLLPERKIWLWRQAPSMPPAICDQLAALYPVGLVEKSKTGTYLDRAAGIPAATAYVDQRTKVRYVVLTWPTQRPHDRLLRLFIELPGAPRTFLYERPIGEATELLHLEPALPASIKDYISRRVSPSVANK